MKHDFDSLYEGPRLQRKSRRRKLNVILSVVVFALFLTIVTFGNPFISKPEETVQHITNEGSSPDEKKEIESVSTTDSKLGTTEQEIGEDSILPNTNNEMKQQEQNQPASMTESDSIVLARQENKWGPIGTVQTEPHYSNYEKGSTDWNEMLKAIGMATGLSTENMIVWWLGNGGAPNTSVATVSSSDQQEIYRVFLQWVENEGWMPTIVERLSENDRRANSSKEEQTSTE